MSRSPGTLLTGLLLLALALPANALSATGGTSPTASAPSGGSADGGTRAGDRAPTTRRPKRRTHRFPLDGPFSYGGEGSRFGAGREGHSHQGQDLSAAEATPIVAPRRGVVRYVGYQASAAGHYAVLDGDAEDRHYVFMHMQTGSVAVRQGQRVKMGQLLGRVGSTGRSSGPHLHFEIWVGGWYGDGEPIDPLPHLRRWDSWS
jgi:murein DD-endopeptidase MepM/ murein hydrolase activator NlpD